MSRPNTIPNRWGEYVSMKNVIEGTRFLPFKTPFSGRVQSSRKFTPVELLNRVGNLGFVINLVKTTRYYNSATYKSRNVEYHHTPFEGNGRIPSRDDIDRVFRFMDRFIEKNRSDPMKLIGVHCTHGVNRTGYVICRYMIEKLGFEPKEAIRRFEEGRGHTFDHREYVEALLELEPEVDRNCKDWHSVGGVIQCARREEPVEFDFAALDRPRERKLQSQQTSSGHERRNPRVSPPRYDETMRGISDRVWSVAREGHRVVQSGRFERYLGPRYPGGSHHWPAKYLGSRRESRRNS